MDGTVVAIRPFVVEGKAYGSEIDIQPQTAPSLLVAVTQLVADPALTVGTTVVGGATKLGRVADLAAVERQALAHYTNDAGNHVTLEVRTAPTAHDRLDATLKILFLADVFGVPGRRAVEEHLPALRETYDADLAIVNGENAADGAGITPKLADKLLAAGADVITLGNHTYRRGGIAAYLAGSERVIRPANSGSEAPGRGLAVVQARNGVAVAVVNLLGQLFLPTPISPWEIVDALVEEARAAAPVVVVDFHAEATSEKVALATWLDGRVTAVIGTHTHVQTNDARILPGGHGRGHRRGHDRTARLGDRRPVRARDRSDADAPTRPVRAGGRRRAAGGRPRHVHRRGARRGHRTSPRPGLTTVTSCRSGSAGARRASAANG